jgi:adenine-specific DNA-methyltransferase
MSTLSKTTPLLAGARPHPGGLVESVDFLRLDASRALDPERQVAMGQFMTPPDVARLMASMFECRGKTLRLLDAGAGIGSLSAAWVAHLCARDERPAAISVVAYEIDPDLADRLRVTMDVCRAHCEDVGIAFTSEIHREDFIAVGVSAEGRLFADSAIEPFDCAIINPPYRKLQTDSKTYRLLKSAQLETSNLYTAFLSIAVRLLRPTGELVAITPRSFCNGPYFLPFRRSFLEAMTLRRIHSFESRSQAFSDDEVLQENVIFHAVKTPARQGTVIVSSSLGPEDECSTWRELDFSRIVKPDDPDLFIHIPANALGDRIVERMDFFRSSLAELGLEASTGRVVDFRATEFLKDTPGPHTAPLIYPGHMVDGYVEWPRNGGKKPNALTIAPETEELLVPKGFYVLVKRFSSKEERRRIVASVYDPERVDAPRVAFENHLNYFHSHGRPLTRDLAKGLAAFLNSTLVDEHFREWSGHTQVNAADLRRLKYPTREALASLGASIPDAFPKQDELDRRIEEDLLHMPKTKKSPDPVRAKRRIQEALAILKGLGLPKAQQNDRSALTLLALLDIEPKTSWARAAQPLRGITEMMGFFADHYGKVYAPNTRETVRRQTVHQFVEAGLAIPNPDQPTRATNSPNAVYQIEKGALALIKLFGTDKWETGLRKYLASVGTLQSRYAQEREMQRIPLTLPTGKIMLSPGGQNELVEKIVHEFCPRFTPRAKPIYVGDTAEKWAFFDEPALAKLGVTVESHGKMPDVVVYHTAKKWLVLVEAVTSHGPVDPKRHDELKRLIARSKVGLVFVTAFLTRRALVKHLGEIAWETEVWVAEAPSHLIHFNGERFLGPYPEARPRRHTAPKASRRSRSL